MEIWRIVVEKMHACAYALLFMNKLACTYFNKKCILAQFSIFIFLLQRYYVAVGRCDVQIHHPLLVKYPFKCLLSVFAKNYRATAELKENLNYKLTAIVLSKLP